MSTLAPAYEIRYREHADEVLVQAFSLDGKPHSGEPRKLKWANLPTLLFQLADSDYTIEPGKKHVGYKSILAFSPAFVAEAVRQMKNAAPY